MASDFELWEQYRSGSPHAFGELVGQHVDWVYSAALRRVRDPHRAEDVTQAVFIALARVKKFRQGVVMSAWLFQVMRYASANLLRSEARRKRRELESARARQMNEDEEQSWETMAPMLDEAVARLGQRDRAAVLLRFYQQHSFAEVGQSLGISEEGARKRTSRAVMKLRRILCAQGLAIPVVALTSGMTSHMTNAAPAGLSSGMSIVLGGAESTTVGVGTELAGKALDTLRRATWVTHLAWGLLAAASIITPIIVWLSLGQTVVISSGATAAPSRQPAGPLATAGDLPDRAADMNLDEIIARLKVAEHVFENVYVKNFNTTIDVLEPEAKDWKPTPIVFAGSAWFDSVPGGSMRVFFSRHVMAWENGAAPYIEQALDESWDGREGREIKIASGGPGKPRTLRDAMSYGDEPMLIQGRFVRYQTGIGFTCQYMVTVEDRLTPKRPRIPLSQWLETAIKAGGEIKVGRQIVNGVDAIRVKWGSQNDIAWTAYWFDPARGFALVKHEYVLQLKGQSRMEELDVLAWKEIQSNNSQTWFPLRGTMIEKVGGKLETYHRYNYQAVDVIVNDPNWNDGIFLINFPSGYRITDARGQKPLSVVLPDGTQQEVRRGEAIPNVPFVPAKRPDAPGEPK